MRNVILVIVLAGIAMAPAIAHGPQPVQPTAADRVERVIGAMFVLQDQLRQANDTLMKLRQELELARKAIAPAGEAVKP